MELLNAILIITKCETPQQLKSLSPERKLNLANALEERVPCNLASIDEWNELLSLFMDTPYESENEIAKNKLLCYLRGKEYVEDVVVNKTPNTNAPASKNKFRCWHIKKNNRK